MKAAFNLEVLVDKEQQALQAELASGHLTQNYQ
jgi:hypothetical protein